MKISLVQPRADTPTDTITDLEKFDGGHVGVAWRALASFLFRSGHVGDSNFDHLFITSNISAMDRLVVVKFHTNIANRWLFMIQRKITAIILYS